MYKRFRCLDACSDCCIYRQYFPSVKYGKTGVLLLPEEKSKIEDYAEKLNLDVKILPRIGTGSSKEGDGPEKILMYQIMGRNHDGDLCPFLDIDGRSRAPHGGYSCRIYEDRPLACRAYPVNESSDHNAPVLDSKCQFCTRSSTQAEKGSLINEIDALKKIRRKVRVGYNTSIWRYATKIGDSKDRTKFLPQGWVFQKT
jgi:Fe-S-cluster containining protein